VSVRVVIDTNVLLANLRGARPSNDLKLVLSDARDGRFALSVPSVVVDETVNKRREAATDVQRRLRQAHSDLAAMEAAFEIPAIDADALADAFREQLVQLLQGAQGTIEPLPDVAHGEVVDRALRRRKPFAGSGAGYRDALIWETILAFARSTDDLVVFITNNKKDFTDGEPSTLAQDLQDDLASVRAEGRVRIVPDLRVFKDTFVAAETIAADELRELLNEDSDLRAQLSAGLADQLRTHVFDRSDISRRERDYDLDLPSDVINWEVESAAVRKIERLFGVWVISARLSDHDVLLELEAELDAEVEIELYIEREGPPFDRREPWDKERHRETRQVSWSRTLLVGAEAMYRSEAKTLEDIYVFHVGL
jgi:hypothetical protein